MFVLCFCAFILGWFLRGYRVLQEVPTARKTFKIAPSPDPWPSQNLDSQKKAFEPYPEDRAAQPSKEPQIISQQESLEKKEKTQKTKPIVRVVIKDRESDLKVFHPQKSQPNETQEEQKEFDSLNRKNWSLLSQGQNLFSSKGSYSLLVNVFSDRTKALDYMGKMKKKYPLWNLFIKFYQNNYKIYIGPFKSKRRANKFAQDFLADSSFPNYLLEKQSL